MLQDQRYHVIPILSNYLPTQAVTERFPKMIKGWMSLRRLSYRNLFARFTYLHVYLSGGAKKKKKNPRNKSPADFLI